MFGFTLDHLGSLGFTWVTLGDLEDFRYSGEFRISERQTDIQTDTGFLGCLEIIWDIMRQHLKLSLFVKREGGVVGKP